MNVDNSICGLVQTIVFPSLADIVCLELFPDTTTGRGAWRLIMSRESIITDTLSMVSVRNADGNIMVYVAYTFVKDVPTSLRIGYFPLEASSYLGMICGAHRSELQKQIRYSKFVYKQEAQRKTHHQWKYVDQIGGHDTAATAFRMTYAVDQEYQTHR